MGDSSNGTNSGIGFKVNTSVSLLTVVIVIIGFVTAVRRSDLAEIKDLNKVILQKIEENSRLQLEDRWRIEAIEKRLEKIEKLVK